MLISLGYCMQQDIHLHSSTVREALEFSALLRQSPEYTHEEKLAYVDHVIDILNMQEYADAVVGVPGSGLNVEQRKRKHPLFPSTLKPVLTDCRLNHWCRTRRAPQTPPLPRRAHFRS